MYKIIDKQCLLYLHEFIEINNCNDSFRNNNMADVTGVKTHPHGLHSLRYTGAKLWNEMPNKLSKEMRFRQYKSLVGNWCQCPCPPVDLSKL